MTTPPPPNSGTETPTPQVDALLKELRALKSNTLSYPCEVQLTQLSRTLERRVNRLKDALQEIADEAVNHHEYNPVSQKIRLPGGYKNILNIASDALSAIDAEGKE